MRRTGDGQDKTVPAARGGPPAYVVPVDAYVVLVDVLDVRRQPDLLGRRKAN